MQRTFSPRTTSSERSLPVYDVALKTPSHIKYRELWNHQSIGRSFRLAAFREKPPKVILNGDIYTFGLEELNRLAKSRQSESLAVEIFLSFHFDETGETTLELHSPIFRRNEADWENKWNKFEIEILFTDQPKTGVDTSFEPFNFENFSHRTRSKEKILSLRHALTVGARCYVSAHKFDFSFSVAVLATSFSMSAIRYLDEIIPTALLNLIVFPGDNLINLTPQAGFIVMDEELRIRLILECDPIVETDVSLVGIWVSRVNKVSDLYVWAHCARYFHHFHNNPEDPFMVIAFDKQSKRPSYYDCRAEHCLEGANTQEFNVYQLFHSAKLQENLPDRKFDLQFNVKMLRQTCEKCLNIPCFSPKWNQRTANASKELTPVYCASPKFDETKTPKVNRSGCSGGEIGPCPHTLEIKSLKETIQSLQSQLDLFRNQTLNGSYNYNHANQILTSTIHFPPLSTTDYDSKGIEEHSEITFGDFQQTNDPEESISESTSRLTSKISDIKEEDIFGEDEAESNIHFENDYAQSKPYPKAKTRKTTPNRQHRPRDYSELYDLSRLDYEISMPESIAPPQMSVSELPKIEYSKDFLEMKKKYNINASDPSLFFSTDELLFQHRRK